MFKLNVDYVLIIRPKPDRTCYDNHIEFLRFLKEPEYCGNNNRLICLGKDGSQDNVALYCGMPITLITGSLTNGVTITSRIAMPIRWFKLNSKGEPMTTNDPEFVNTLPYCNCDICKRYRSRIEEYKELRVISYDHMYVAKPKQEIKELVKREKKVYTNNKNKLTNTNETQTNINIDEPVQRVLRSRTITYTEQKQKPRINSTDLVKCLNGLSLDVKEK